MSILGALAANRRGPAINRYEVLQFTQTVNTNRSQTSQLDGLPPPARAPCLPRNDLLTPRRSRSNERNLFSRELLDEVSRDRRALETNASFISGRLIELCATLGGSAEAFRN